MRLLFEKLKYNYFGYDIYKAKAMNLSIYRVNNHFFTSFEEAKNYIYQLIEKEMKLQLIEKEMKLS